MFPKLSESFILNEIVELLKNGHDVQIFSIIKPWEEEVHDEIKKYNILEITHYFSFKSILKINIISFLKYLLFGVIQDLYDLRSFIQAVSKPKATHTQSSIVHPNKKIESKIHRIGRFGIACPRRFLLDLKIAYFATIVEDKNVKLIHTHFASMGGIARRLSKMLGLPYTLTAHAFDIYVNTNANELRKVMDNAESVVTISEYNKNYLINKIGVSNRIDVIRCGIELNKFDSQRKSKSEGRLRILTVSRLVEKKGIEYLIKSIPTTIKEIPNLEFIVVGSGPLNSSLQQLVNHLNIDSYIKFKGDVSDSELFKYYNHADIFVLPCIIAENGDRDGIPVSMMEAMAMEIPLVSTKVSGIPELVKDGVSGIIVPPKDEKAISEALIKLLNNEDLRVQMGKAGRQIILEKYNVTIEGHKLMNMFRNFKSNTIITEI